VPVLLLLLSVSSSFSNYYVWLFAFLFILGLLILSVLAIVINDQNKGPLELRNRISDKIKQFTVIFGSGQRLYSGVFLFFLLFNYTSSDPNKISTPYFVAIIIIWAIILSINPSDLHSLFSFKKLKLDKQAIGEIFGVQSKKIFLVKLFEDRKQIKKFDLVKFRYSMQSDDTSLITGIVFDTYLLNKEKWAKVLQLGNAKRTSYESQKNITYLVAEDERQQLASALKIDRFVGVVVEGSKIGKIKFEYSKKKDDLKEGDLLELFIDEKRLFYQVINGTTNSEKLEDRNEMGFIEGEAIQLGMWDTSNFSFIKYGWVPTINTPMFISDTRDIPEVEHVYPEYRIGNVPGTSLPSIINLDDLVSHHTALVGVTGSGKSFLAREILTALSVDTKIVCVDFTSEWKGLLSINDVVPTILNKDNIHTYLTGDDRFGVVELPSLSNTEEIIQATERLFSTIFEYAKSAYTQGEPKKICLVLEEAHTIVPEGSFLGVNSFDSKALVNKMGQIALQGRKYGVGLLVIAQRTANVSKTVLTQCNTVVCFQAFDETTFNFLSNYIGKDLVEALPNLPQYHAIITGKAVKSNTPMIINLERD